MTGHITSVPLEILKLELKGTIRGAPSTPKLNGLGSWFVMKNFLKFSVHIADT